MYDRRESRPFQRIVQDCQRWERLGLLGPRGPKNNPGQCRFSREDRSARRSAVWQVAHQLGGPGHYSSQAAVWLEPCRGSPRGDRCHVRSLPLGRYLTARINLLTHTRGGTPLLRRPKRKRGGPSSTGNNDFTICRSVGPGPTPGPPHGRNELHWRVKARAVCPDYGPVLLLGLWWWLPPIEERIPFVQIPRRLLSFGGVL